LLAVPFPTGAVDAPPESVFYQTDEATAVPSALQSIAGTRLLADVATLSGGEFDGRQTGTTNDLKSAEFVAQRFASLHLTLTPLVVSRWGTPHQLGTAMPVPVFSILDNPHLELSDSNGSSVARMPADYLPVLDSPAVNTTGQVMFVGYGIADAVNGYDEYDGLDVRNKIVMFLRGKPDHYPAPVSHAEKERTAREKGAVAYLTVTGPIMSSYELRRGMTTHPGAFYGGRQDSVLPLAGAWISPALADKILLAFEPDALTLRGFQESSRTSRRPLSRPTRSSVRMVWEAKDDSGILHNVIATIPGRDPDLRNERIVLGAHRDHFGRQAGLVFPGADDNASGTAVIMEVARAITDARLWPRRTVVIVSFSGEEQGLLGSRFYMSRPLQQTSKPKAMINVDHTGIGNERLTVGVTGMEKSVAMEAGQRAGLADRVDLFGFFPGGDHVPFKEAGVPTVTVVSGGPHTHFHKPTDTADTINPDILEATARYVFTLLWLLANQP
jgi:hypothetical protein